MAKKRMITSGQLFTLVFICRLSLTVLYSSRNSGIKSLRELILPLMLLLPVMLLMLLPVTILSGSRKSPDSGSKALNTCGIFSGGKALTFCYGIYFLFTAAYSIASIYDFMLDVLPFEVYPKAILSFLIIGCIYAAVKGIEAVSRMSLAVLVLFIIASVIIAAYLYPSYSSTRLLQSEGLFTVSVLDGTFFLISRTAPAAVIGVFEDNIKTGIKKGLLSCLILSLVFMILTAILLVGSAGDYLDSRDFQIFRSIDSSAVLQRLDPLFLLVAVCSIFCNITLFILAASKCMDFSIKKLTEKKASFFIGAALIVFALSLPTEGTPYVFYHKYLWGGAAIIFVTILPLLLLIRKNLRKKRRGIVRIAAAGLTVMLVLFMTGCSKIQLNNRIIVQGIGIDKQDDGYRLTLITLNIEDPKKENAVRLLYSKGKSVSAALSSVEQQNGKKLLLNQCLFISMNKQASKNNINTLSCFINDNDIPKSLDLITTENSAEFILSSAINELGYSSGDISAIAGSGAAEHYSEKCTLFEYISQTNKNRPVVFPLIKIDPDIKALCLTGGFNA